MKRLFVIGLVALAALAGCGGGGGDSPASTAPGQIESLNVWKSFLSADRTYTTRGTGSDGAAYEISTTIRPKGTAQFGPSPTATIAAYSAVEVTNAVKRNNVAYSSTSTLFYIQPSDSTLAALVDPVGGTCVVPDAGVQPPVVPATAALNASGRLLNGSSYVYGTSTNRCFPPNAVVGAPGTALTWSYEADAGKPLFCVNYATTRPGDNRLQASCFEVTGVAGLGGASRFTLSATGLTLTAKNY